MIMPWGKYVDEDIVNIPSYYLRWLSENCKDNDIVVDVEYELEYRDETNNHF